MNMPNAMDIARDSMALTLKRQRRSFLAEGEVKYKTRISRIERAINLVLSQQERLMEAMNSDFGHRSTHQSLITDIAASIGPLRFAKKHLRKWMKPEKRSVEMPLGLLGTKAWVEHQPLGVVGLISPWNFPVQLTFGPLAGILAAGNRVMIKPSEYTPATSDLMREILADVYDTNELTVVTGDAGIGQAFSSLPFDHLMFTGSGATARYVMYAAAEHLVPVTLELGGKSPVIIGRGVSLWLSAERIMLGKMLNAGQVCLAPDYVMLPRNQIEPFVDAARQSVHRMFPTLLDNPDYCSIINEHHYYRLQGYLEDARNKGATIIEINPADENFGQQPYYKMPPTLVLDVNDSMQIMQDEIFGPILPVKEYDLLEEAIGYVNDHARPLALYYFGMPGKEERQVLSQTTSGGVTLNDVIMHVSQEDLPFGGVGPSGMGAYKGRDGFRNFSHRKAIFRQSKLDVAKLAGITPPWDDSKFSFMIKRMVKR